MKYRPLGKSGIEASVVGFGAWAIGGWMWGGTKKNDPEGAIHAAVDHGINLIDTAPMYGYGRSEELVGQAIKSIRDRVVLASKCGLVWYKKEGDKIFDANEEGRAESEDDKSYEVYINLKPAMIRYEIDESLRRLKTDRIDLYQTHRQDSTTRTEDVMAELMLLKQEGKIRAIGCSNATVEHMGRYRSAGQLDTDQEQYSMLQRQQEAHNLSFCRENDIAFLAYSPLALGILTGKIGPKHDFGRGDLRWNNPGSQKEQQPQVDALLEVVRERDPAKDTAALEEPLRGRRGQACRGHAHGEVARVRLRPKRGARAPGIAAPPW